MRTLGTWGPFPPRKRDLLVANALDGKCGARGLLREMSRRKGSCPRPIQLVSFKVSGDSRVHSISHARLFAKLAIHSFSIDGVPGCRAPGRARSIARRQKPRAGGRGGGKRGLLAAQVGGKCMGILGPPRHFFSLGPPKVAVSMDITSKMYLLKGKFSDPCFTGFILGWISMVFSVSFYKDLSVESLHELQNDT